MKRSNSTWMCIILFLAAQLSCLLATDYMVYTPDDITAAMNDAGPGDTLTLANGIWNDARIIVKGFGEETRPILVRAETPGLVRITGKSNLRIGGSHIIVDGLYFTNGYSPSGGVIEFRRTSGDEASHCRLTNTAIVSFNPPSKGTDYKWVSLYGQYNRVDHCFFENKTHSGTTLVVWLAAQPNYHLIDHNHFGYRPDFGANGAETIRVGTSTWSMYDSYTIVEYNYFERCDGETEIISNKSCENIYRYNTFYNSEGTLTLRHGNRCTVHSNFFLGNGNDRAGGVRIIGEDHLVYNNYFQDLMGTGYRAALPVMNGVPNSPLNRYFQVKNARVLFNTFVNCFENIVLGAGESDELSLPPKDCLIANNAISTIFSNEIVTVEDEPENLQWQGNIFEGYNLGIALPDGITMEDSLFLFAEDSLWRPSEGSPLIGAAEGDFSFITADMDGQPRSGAFEVGADQLSIEQVINRPLGPDDVGPGWYPPPQPPEPVIYVGAGIDSLWTALQLARDGDILELITDGGIYENTHDLEITKNISIRAGDSLQNRPVLRQIESDNSARSIFVLGGNGRLTLEGIELDGMRDSETPAKYLIRSEDVPLTKEYRLVANDCYFHDVSLDGNGNFFRAYAGTRADSIIFTNCLFGNAGKEGIRLKDEADGSGQYNVSYFEMTNCTMWNVPKEAVYIYAGDDNMFTTSPIIEINHCTFDNCGYDTASVINARECDFTTIKNSLITNSPASPGAVALYGQAADISYSDVYNSGEIAIERGAQTGPGMLYVDPVYTDAVNGNFRLDETSPVIGKAEDGQAMGDLRWAEGLTGINPSDGGNVIYSFELSPGYPNPFNPSTTIRYAIQEPGFVTLAVYDINGRLVEELDHAYKNSGQYTHRWNARDRASGIYFCTLKWKGQIRTQKLILMR